MKKNCFSQSYLFVFFQLQLQQLQQICVFSLKNDYFCILRWGRGGAEREEETAKRMMKTETQPRLNRNSTETQPKLYRDSILT